MLQPRQCRDPARWPSAVLHSKRPADLAEDGMSQSDAPPAEDGCGETFQRSFGSFHAAHILPHVELGHLVSGALSGIFHVDGNLNVVFGSSRGTLHHEVIVANVV